MSLLSDLRKLVLIIFGMIYLFSAFYPWETIQFSMAMLMFLIILITLPVAGKTNRNVSLVLLTLGGGLLLLTKANLDQWVQALGSNSGLVALFIALPFLSFPIKYENYQEALQRFSLKHIKGVVPFGNFSALLTFFLVSLINIGAFQIIYNLFNQSQNFKKYEYTLYRSMVRANFAAVFWSPNYVAVAVIIHYLDLPWVNIVPLGLTMAATVLFSNWLQIKLTNGLTANEGHLIVKEISSLEVKLDKDDTRQLWKLVTIFFSLITYVLILNIFTDLNILTIVPIVALTFPLFLAIFQKKLVIYREQLRNYYHVSLPNIKNEIIIFAAAGFFGKSLEVTGVGQLIPGALGLNRIEMPFLLIIMLMLITACLAFIGVHPVVTSSTFATTIDASVLGLTTEGYAILLLASFGLAVMVSPFSGTSLVLSGVCKHSPWQIGPRMNIYYTLTMGIVFAILIPLLGGV